MADVDTGEDARLNAGDVAKYSMQVSNPGNTCLMDIAARDEDARAISCDESYKGQKLRIGHVALTCRAIDNCSLVKLLALHLRRCLSSCFTCTDQAPFSSALSKWPCRVEGAWAVFGCRNPLGLWFFKVRRTFRGWPPRRRHRCSSRRSVIG